MLSLMPSAQSATPQRPKGLKESLTPRELRSGSDDGKSIVIIPTPFP